MAVDVRCPSCNKWLAEVHDYGRSVCPDCGYEVTIRSKSERFSGSVSDKAVRPVRLDTRR